MRIEFYLDDELRVLEIPSDRSLLDILRDQYAIRHVREGCRRGHCGSCTVLMNDFPVASCLIPAFNLPGSHVETIQGLMNTEDFEHLETGFLRAGFFPCKHCAASKTLLAASILRREEGPVEEGEILEYCSDSWCSCSSQTSFARGILYADSLRRKRRTQYANRG